MLPQLSPPSGQGATYRRRLYRSQCRGCGELFFHERAPGGVRIIRAVLIAVLLGVVGFLARIDQHPERQVVVQALRDTENADASLLPHLSPLGWEHMNLTRKTTTGVRTSKSNRATSGPYRRSIGLSVRFFPFREVTQVGRH